MPSDRVTFFSNLAACSSGDFEPACDVPCFGAARTMIVEDNRAVLLVNYSVFLWFVRSLCGRGQPRVRCLAFWGSAPALVFCLHVSSLLCVLQKIQFGVTSRISFLPEYVVVLPVFVSPFCSIKNMNTPVLDECPVRSFVVRGVFRFLVFDSSPSSVERSKVFWFRGLGGMSTSFSPGKSQGFDWSRRETKRHGYVFVTMLQYRRTTGQTR